MTKMHNSQPLLSKKTQIFLMCCDMKNFSAVARALGVTQSAVSKAISLLETEVGFELFVRNCRPLTLTPEAQLLHKHLRNITGEFSQFITQIQSENFLKPVLRVGIIESLSLNLGVEIIKQFLPSLSQVAMLVGSGNVLTERLVERKLDLVISNDRARLPKFVHQRLIFEEPSVLLLPKRLTAQAKGPWTWERLQCCGLPLVRFWDRSGAGQLNNAFIRLQGFQFAERISVDSNALTMALIKENLAWAFTRPTTVLQNIHQLEDITVAEMQPPVLSRQVFVMGREAEFETEARRLAEFCEQVLAQKIVPEMIEFAPWIKSQVQIGGRKFA